MPYQSLVAGGDAVRGVVDDLGGEATCACEIHRAIVSFFAAPPPRVFPWSGRHSSSRFTLWSWDTQDALRGIKRVEAARLFARFARLPNMGYSSRLTWQADRFVAVPARVLKRRV